MRMKKIGNAFIRGLVILLPSFITLYLLYYFGAGTERVLGKMLKVLIPNRFYIPGMGIIVGALGIVVFGAMVDAYIFKRLYKKYEQLLSRVPLVKTLYGAISDLMSLFSGQAGKAFQKVVMVRIISDEIRMIGMVTREDFSSMPDGLQANDIVAVYLPMSYQLGGFTVMIPRSMIQPIEMSVEDAMRFVITAGISTKKETEE